MFAVNLEVGQHLDGQLFGRVDRFLRGLLRRVIELESSHLLHFIVYRLGDSRFSNFFNVGENIVRCDRGPLGHPVSGQVEFDLKQGQSHVA